MKKLITWPAILLVAALLTTRGQAQPGSPDGLTYRTGWSHMVKFGMDLYKALKPQFKPKVHVKPVNIETDVTPFVRLEELKSPELPNPMASIFISVGFIDLVNNVAHAKAIDRIEKGYFQRYVLSLAQESGEKELHELPNLTNKRYWTEDIMNEQFSSFNQMVGVVVAMNLAHYYLGHYEKYAAKLTDAKGNPVPINTLLTDKEWDEAIKNGLVNSLNVGLATDGVKALFDCIDKMPKRPTWTLYFLPEKVKVPKLIKDMEKMEKRFFAGEQL